MRRWQDFFFTVGLAGLLTSMLAVFPLGCSSGPRVVSDRRTSQSRSCLGCHEEFGNFSSAHLVSAEGDGCDKCHLPHGLVGVLRLKGTEPKLCLDCHEDIEHADTVADQHVPDRGECSACHDSHGRETRACNSCHVEVDHVAPAHGELDAGCLACHKTHGDPTGGLLAGAEPDVCVACHSVGDGGIRAAHRDIPLGRGRCTECHDAHGSTPHPAALRLAAHPTTLEGRCEACHEPGATDLLMPAGELCRSCHADVEGDHAWSTHPGLAEDQCLDCHAAHAGLEGPVLKDTASELCVQCHEGLPEIPGAHAPVASGQCLSCHSGHGSEHDLLLLRPNDRSLCVDCHADEVAGYDAHSVAHEPLDDCASCHSGHGTGKEDLLLAGEAALCGICHPSDFTSGAAAGSSHEPVAAGRCSDCHDPHGGAERGLLASKTGDLCLSCHEDHVPEALGAVVHDPIGWKLCTSCHDPHISEHPGLLSAPEPDLCVQCHGETHRLDLGASVLHQPVREGSCLDCHEPHGGSHEHLLRVAANRACLECHADTIESAAHDKVPHQPVQRGDCLSCHSGHRSEFASLVRESVPGLCSSCHALDTGEFKSSHLQLSGEGMDCLSCHDSHGSDSHGMLLPEVHDPVAQGDCSACHEK